MAQFNNFYLAASSNPATAAYPRLTFKRPGDSSHAELTVSCDEQEITVELGKFGESLMNPRIIREFLAEEAARKFDGHGYFIRPRQVRRMKVRFVK